MLPYPQFQQVMATYDLPMIEADTLELKSLGFSLLDHKHKEYVGYYKLFEQLMPR